MFIERDLRELSNVSSHQFPDRSAKWLIRQREHLLTKENTQNQEIVNMAESIIEISEQRGLQQGIEQGIEQGARQTSIESTLTILNTRFPDAEVDTLKPALEAIDDINRLKQLIREASIVDTFHAFKERLQA